MKILVINAGSSSLKYQLIDMESSRFSMKMFPCPPTPRRSLL